MVVIIPTVYASKAQRLRNGHANGDEFATMAFMPAKNDVDEYDKHYPKTPGTR